MYCHDVPMWYNTQVVRHFATTFSQRLLQARVLLRRYSRDGVTLPGDVRYVRFLPAYASCR